MCKKGEVVKDSSCGLALSNGIRSTAWVSIFSAASRITSLFEHLINARLWMELLRCLNEAEEVRRMYDSGIGRRCNFKASIRKVQVVFCTASMDTTNDFLVAV